MSSLCTTPLLYNSIQIQERPSPIKNHSRIISLVEDLVLCPIKGVFRQIAILKYIKGISAFTFLKQSSKASMTVEAAVVLPIFLFFVLSMGNAIEMIRLHSKLELAMWNVGNEVAVYGYAMQDGASGSDGGTTERDGTSEQGKTGSDSYDIPAGLLSLAYTRSRVEELLGTEYLDASPLSKGADGLNFWETNLQENGQFDLVVTYEVSPDAGLLDVWRFRMANRYYGHLWNGYDLSSVAQEGQQGWVYVAENGEVYHEDRNCTHLQLSIREVSLAQALTARNEDGERYEACSVCGGEADGECVYITQSGDCYHSSRQCSGLKRTIYTIPRGEIDDYRPCSRCSTRE